MESLEKGKYRIVEKGFSPNTFYKLFGKESLLFLTIGLLIYVEIILFYSINSNIILIYLAYFSLILINIIVEFLIINILFFNRKYPEKKKLDAIFLFFALIFINVNYIIPISSIITEMVFNFNNYRVFLFNIIASITIISVLSYKAILYLLKRRKQRNTDKPMLIFYITSSFTVCFSSMSLYSIIVYTIEVLYLVNLLIAIGILFVILIKTYIHKIRQKQEHLTKGINILITIIFIILSTSILLFSIIFGIEAIRFYQDHYSSFFLITFPNFEIIWNLNNLFISLIVVSIILVISFHIHRNKPEILLFDWEESNFI